MSEENLSEQTVDKSVNETAGTETKDNSTELLADLVKAKNKFRMISEHLGFGEGLDINQLQEKINEKKASKQSELDRIESERTSKLNETELLREELGNFKTQFESMLSENSKMKKESEYNSRKSQVQTALLESGAKKDSIKDITDLFMISDSGGDVLEAVNKFKNSRLTFFDSNQNVGANKGIPADATQTERPTQVKGYLGEYMKK